MKARIVMFLLGLFLVDVQKVEALVMVEVQTLLQ